MFFQHRLDNKNSWKQLTWIYLSALLSTHRLEVFFSSKLGIIFFNVSKHSFRWARLSDDKTPKHRERRQQSVRHLKLKLKTMVCSIRCWICLIFDFGTLVNWVNSPMLLELAVNLSGPCPVGWAQMSLSKNALNWQKLTPLLKYDLG